jgi:2-oxoglutarate ferredoxin oxidoreductase subunit gamma
MNRPSLDKFEPALVKDGLLLINSSLIDRGAKRDDVRAYLVPANEIANELGNSKIANMVMLGAYLEATGAIKKESVLEALKKVFGERKAHLIPINKDALDRGAEVVKGSSCG